MKILNFCPSCQTKTIQNPTGSNGVYNDCGHIVKEYLYRCQSCNANIWVDEQDVNNSREDMK